MGWSPGICVLTNSQVLLLLVLRPYLEQLDSEQGRDQLEEKGACRGGHPGLGTRMGANRTEWRNCGKRSMFRWLVLSPEKVTRAQLHRELQPPLLRVAQEVGRPDGAF